MKDAVRNTIKALKENGFEVQYFKNSSDLKTTLMEQIPLSSSVGIGGAKTIHELGLHRDLTKRGQPVFWHWLGDQSQRTSTLQLASQTNIYLSSANGITEDGKIINIDGVGNRTSSICYGHEKIYFIVGTNKISKNASDSIHRIKTEACPQNAERLDLQTPCRYLKKCTDCSSPDRMCNITLILEKCPMKADISVFIVPEKLGF
ncbi:lactate utilization protein [Gottschalkiaceae bacterium SANA]|nr:lactate utilization protein [Gottschalkiaceae bacterium SANA]